MDVPALIIFLLITLLGSYIQAVAGFAMGMLIVAVAGGLRLLEIETLAAVVYSQSYQLGAIAGVRANTCIASFCWLAAGQLPALALGLYFLDQLGANARWLLELCLGVFLTLGALGMLLKPKPLQRVSPSCGLAHWIVWRHPRGYVFCQWPCAWAFRLQSAAAAKRN